MKNFQTLCLTLYKNLPSTKTPMRYGVGASNKAVILGGNAGISVCCHINGKSKDSMASKSADKSLEKEKLVKLEIELKSRERLEISGL